MHSERAKAELSEAVCTGLDSSTTFLIVKCIRNFTKALEVSGMCNQELRPPMMHFNGKGIVWASGFEPIMLFWCLPPELAQRNVLMALLQPAPEMYELST